MRARSASVQLDQGHRANDCREPGTSAQLYLTPVRREACLQQCQAIPPRCHHESEASISVGLVASVKVVSSQVHEALLVVTESANGFLIVACLWMRDLQAKCEG